MTTFIDPAPGMYPHCRCTSSCELPCWQRDGFDPDFDADDPNGCCCAGAVDPDGYVEP